MSEGGLDVETKPGPVGLGGWLILPMLGLFASPLVGLAEVRTYTDLAEAWRYLSIGQSAFIIVEIAINVALLLIAPIILLIFMFKRLEMFPGWYMIWLGATPFILIADVVVSYMVFREVFTGGLSEAFDRGTVRSIGQSVFGAAIWIPYMMRSERVANTFVN